MKVRELIAELQKLEQQDAEVVFVTLEDETELYSHEIHNVFLNFEGTQVGLGASDYLDL